jgi:hypothetical protein
MYLAADIKLYFDFDSQKLELDQNPLEDPELTPLSNIAFDKDLSELQFDAVYRGRRTHFVVSLKHECDKIIFGFFFKLIDSGFSVKESDLDDVELTFEKGKLESVQIFKHSKDYDLLDSLDIVAQDGTAFLVKQCPWRKISLDTVTVSDGKIISKAGNKKFTYRLEAQPLIFDLIKRLIESCGPV